MASIQDIIHNFNEKVDKLTDEVFKNANQLSLAVINKKVTEIPYETKSGTNDPSAPFDHVREVISADIKKMDEKRRKGIKSDADKIYTKLDNLSRTLEALIEELSKIYDKIDLRTISGLSDKKQIESNIFACQTLINICVAILKTRDSFSDFVTLKS